MNINFRPGTNQRRSNQNNLIPYKSLIFFHRPRMSTQMITYWQYMYTGGKSKYCFFRICPNQITENFSASSQNLNYNTDTFQNRVQKYIQLIWQNMWVSISVHLGNWNNYNFMYSWCALNPVIWLGQLKRINRTLAPMKICLHAATYIPVYQNYKWTVGYQQRSA